MPGKVNPVMSEMLLMICAQVIGNDVTVGWGGAAGNFELNVMIPVIAYNVLHSIGILANGCRLFASRCVEGIEPNEARCEELIEQSLAMVTALNPRIGYDAAAAIAKESVKTGKTVRELCLEKNVLPADELARLLDARSMTGS
jgi:fumarate hydratase, class II